MELAGVAVAREHDPRAVGRPARAVARVPSGDQAPGNPPSVVSWVSPVPSALMTKTSERPLRKLANAIRLPSGDQIGSTFPPAVLVTRVTPDPSGFIT